MFRRTKPYIVYVHQHCFLLRVVEPSRILFGNDYGMQAGITTNSQNTIKGVKEYSGQDKEALYKGERDNALKLIPRFKEWSTS